MIWVVNDKEDFDEIVQQFEPYLDGVMTDMPTTLQEYARDYSGYWKDITCELVSEQV